MLASITSSFRRQVFSASCIVIWLLCSDAIKGGDVSCLEPNWVVEINGAECASLDTSCLDAGVTAGKVATFSLSFLDEDELKRSDAIEPDSPSTDRLRSTIFFCILLLVCRFDVECLLLCEVFRYDYSLRI